MTLAGRHNLPHVHRTKKDNIDRVVLATVQNPGAMQTEIAAQAGVTPRAIQKYMAEEDTRDYIEKKIASLLRANDDLLAMSMTVKREGMKTVLKDNGSPREFENVKDEVNAKQVALRASEQTDQVFGLYKTRIEVEPVATGGAAGMLEALEAKLARVSGGEPSDAGTDDGDGERPALPSHAERLAGTLLAEPDAESGGGGGEPERQDDGGSL